MILNNGSFIVSNSNAFSNSCSAAALVLDFSLLSWLNCIHIQHWLVSQLVCHIVRCRCHMLRVVVVTVAWHWNLWTVDCDKIAAMVYWIYCFLVWDDNVCATAVQLVFITFFYFGCFWQENTCLLQLLLVLRVLLLCWYLQMSGQTICILIRQCILTRSIGSHTLATA